MKRFFKWIGSVSLLALIAVPSFSAVTPVNTDVVDYCTGPNNSNCVFRIDKSGNVTTAGTLAVTGASTFTGATTTAGTEFVTGKTAYTPTVFGGGQIATFGIIGSSVIPYTATNMVILGSASLTITSLPTISTNVIAGLTGVGGTGGVIDDGSYIVLTTTSTTGIVYRIKDNSTLSGSLLDLSGVAPTTEIISSTRPVTLMFNAGTGHWVQTSPFNGF